MLSIRALGARTGVASPLAALAVLCGNGAPVNGVTGLGIAPQGTFYRDKTNGQYYTNQGTSAAPDWHMIFQV